MILKEGINSSIENVAQTKSGKFLAVIFLISEAAGAYWEKGELQAGNKPIALHIFLLSFYLIFLIITLGIIMAAIVRQSNCSATLFNSVNGSKKLDCNEKNNNVNERLPLMKSLKAESKYFTA